MGKTQEETMSNPFIPKDVKLHALTRAEEENCFKELKANALEACQVPIKDFVDCSKEHNVTVMFTCRSKLKIMNNCLKERTSEEELDKLKLAKLSNKLKQ
ncbi:hypothetical protein G6F46_003680 [Rhizopus delemar]|nr:hypothetical protein G6F43_006475 [Rhizopus delemar]KAG1146474.1 hypothetical protein G6F38_004908 [Rhizopus arrhizus]KAG1162254.1 hypothetical protein G6F37_002322 [Rhizopus arrhizus]KAG1463912.1 hypothetical protein G6F55_002109 [Rhizopus delemar]KAG1498073.1 hypothetical protein G6F54_005329 [Rhizopus delemar]